MRLQFFIHCVLLVNLVSNLSGQHICDSVLTPSSHNFVGRLWEGQTLQDFVASKRGSNFRQFPLLPKEERLNLCIADASSMLYMSSDLQSSVLIEFGYVNIQSRDYFAYPDACETGSTIRKIDSLHGVFPCIDKYRIIESIRIDSTLTLPDAFNDLVNVNQSSVFFAYRPPAV